MPIDLIEKILCKYGRAELQTWSCADFIKVARSCFDLNEVEKVLGKYKPHLGGEEWDSLCFRYRDVPEFLASSLIGFSYGLQRLHEEAKKHITECNSVVEELFSSNRKEVKNEYIYRELYKKQLNASRKINLRKYFEALQKEGETEAAYHTLRQGYTRWCKRNPDPLLQKRLWPSKEFIYFFAFISVHYVKNPEPLADKKHLLKNDSSDWELQQLWKTSASLELVWSENTDKIRFEKISKNKKLTKKEKIEKIRTLAIRNNIPAVKYLLNKKSPNDVHAGEDLTRKQLLLHAAILMPSE